MSSCAARPRLCDSPSECKAGLECVAGRCEGTPSTLAGSRRIVLEPTEMAVIEAGGSGPRGALPPRLTLGRSGDATELLLRFDVHVDRSATILRASVLLERAEALMEGEAPVPLRANRVIGKWDERRVTWTTAPATEDVRSPRTVVRPSGPGSVRVDVTDICSRWPSHSGVDHGLVILAEGETATGVSFALGTSSLAASEPRPGGADGQVPRLELYVR